MPSKYSIEYPGNKTHKNGSLQPIGSHPVSLNVPLAGSGSVILGTNFVIYDPYRCEVKVILGEVITKETGPGVTVTRLMPGASTEIISRQPYTNPKAASRISLERI